VGRCFYILRYLSVKAARFEVSTRIDSRREEELAEAAVEESDTGLEEKRY
jgi:hypothetical protein